MKKLLIITYYWPPGGGAGVQRWLKLSKYLAMSNIEVHVLSVDPDYASYMIKDESLISDIHPDIHVHLTKSFEPINYYAKLVGKKNVPVAGFSNVDNTSWKQKIVTALRSNLFVPDPRKGWNKYAIKKAQEVIKAYGISHVITTSPPHSSQLIGLKLKKTFKDKIKWIADFRDPWTDIYYYDLLRHSFLSHAIDKKYEKSVIENSDAIITVGDKFKSSLLSKSDNISDEKISIITNGFDPTDFKNSQTPPDEEFVISYTGTISDYYQPEVFFYSLNRLIDRHPDYRISFRLVGIVSDTLKEFITKQIGENALFIPPVSHDEAISYMQKSHILLLITQGEEGTIPGKTFEYLASQRRIICLGKGDASQAIADCEAGASFSRDEEDKLFEYLSQSMDDFINKKDFKINSSRLKKYSREYQARQVINLLTS